jgi:hypothetical protein
MFITNTENRFQWVFYTVAGKTSKVRIPAHKTVEVSDVTDVSQINFNAHDTRLRFTANKYPNRIALDNSGLRDSLSGTNVFNVVEGVAAQLALSGGTV